jgi:hypothetical protein
MQGWRTTSVRGSCWASELLLVACLAACKDDLPIVLVELRDDSEHQVAFDKSKAELFAVTTIGKLPGYTFRHAKPNERGWQYIFTMDLAAERTADGDATKRHRGVGGTISLKEVGGEGAFETTVLDIADEPATVPFDEAVERALIKGAEQLAIAMKLQTGSDGELLEQLDASNEQIKGQAIELVGKRKIQKAVPKLMQIVRDPAATDDVVLKAIGSLVQIGDQEASGAIIDAGKNRSPESMLQLLFALGQLGGLEAEAYLFTVQNGHPDPLVRQSATDALKELELRREEKKKLGPVRE